MSVGSYLTLSCKLASWFLQSTPSEDCLLIRKNTSLENTKTVELSHEEHMKLSEPSVQKHVPKSANINTNCPSVVAILFKSIGITLRQLFRK